MLLQRTVIIEEKLTIIWYRENVFTNNKTWRKIRYRKDDPMVRCNWCHDSYEPEAPIHLACTEEKGNVTLCTTCLNEVKHHEKHLQSIGGSNE